MHFGSYQSIANCFSGANANYNIECSRVSYSAKASTYQNEELHFFVTANSTLTERSISSGSYTEKIKINVQLEDPKNFYYQLAQMTTLIRLHICTDLKYCNSNTETRDLELNLIRDEGQRTLTGSITTNLIFNEGTLFVQEIESVELLIPGVFYPVIISQ